MNLMLPALSLLGFTLMVATVPSFASGQERNSVVVKSDQFYCVMANLDGYLKATGDPVLILFDNCPNPRVAPEDLIALTQASGANKRSDAPARAASLQKSTLECLRSKLASGELEIRSDTDEAVEIKLKDCLPSKGTE